MYKYHNFKQNIDAWTAAGLTAFYVSKAGHDSNAGTSPNEPKLTIQASASCLVGAGNYEASSMQGHVIGDGKVVIKPVLVGGEILMGATTEYFNLDITGANFNLSNTSQAGPRIENCILRFCTNIIGSSGTSRYRRLIKCIVLDCTFGQNLTQTGGYHMITSVIIRGTLYLTHGTRFYSSYVGKDTILVSKYIGVGEFLDYHMSYSNIQGRIVRGGISYELKRKKDGSPAEGTNPNYRDAIEVYPYIYTYGNFNENPKFADAAGEDYTLQADSPHIRAGEGGINIGGTLVSTSVVNTDEGNGRGTRVLPQVSINTILPSSYMLHDGYSEGYVDYVEFIGDKKLLNLDLKSLLMFNADVPGGQIGNKNVPDAEPVTSQYSKWITTTVASTLLNEVIVPTGKIQVGNHVRVLGKPREVISKTTNGANDYLTVNTAFPTAIGLGVEVVYGSVFQLAALNPNRLTVFMRTKNTEATPSIPFVDSEWDNGLDPSFNKAGYLFNQEINTQPLLYINGSDVYGGGDSDLPANLTPITMSPQWVHIRVYLRNNYSSKGEQG